MTENQRQERAIWKLNIVNKASDLLHRLLGWIKRSTDTTPKPDRWASDEVIEEYKHRMGKQAAAALKGIRLDHESRVLQVALAMMSDAIPPEERPALQERIRQIEIDHYRRRPMSLSPSIESGLGRGRSDSICSP